MGQRRHHYEQAFGAYLRSRRTPYVSVHEARKALLPQGASLNIQPAGEPNGRNGAGADRPIHLKSFDFVVYGEPINHLVDVKGRKIPRRSSKALARSRLESWVTQDDVDSLRTWEHLFGEGFRAGFVFVYWCDEQPPAALFEEIFEHRGQWYALRAVTLADYVEAMRPRSARWRTVHVPTERFERISRPFYPPTDPPPFRLEPGGDALQPLGACLSSS